MFSNNVFFYLLHCHSTVSHVSDGSSEWETDVAGLFLSSYPLSLMTSYLALVAFQVVWWKEREFIDWFCRVSISLPSDYTQK